jgi:Acetyltransferase (GNAT) domain
MRSDLPMTLLEKARLSRSALRERIDRRKVLRGPAGLRYAVADSIAMLDSAAWRAVTSDASWFLSRDYLAAIESVLPLNIAPRYALIFSGEPESLAPIAAVVMQRIDIALAQTRPLPAQKHSAPWLAAVNAKISAARQRVLVAGNFLTFGMHGVALAPNLDAQAVRQAWHGVAEVLYRVRQSDKLTAKTDFLLIKDLHAPHTKSAKLLEDLSYRFVETEPDMVLAIDSSWRNYEDYLAALSAKYRGNIRTGVLKPIDDAGCRVEHVDDLAALKERLYQLYIAVYERASLRPFVLQPTYFAALRAAAGDRCRCSVIWRGEQAVGFLITIADGDTALAYHIGFDREAAAALPIYLRLLHAGIADAIALRCRQVSFGRTALEPKAALGAKPRPFGVLIRHRQPVLNALIKGLLNGVEHDEPPDRNPFKKKP